MSRYHNGITRQEAATLRSMGEAVGNSVSGKAVTATLYVSPNGDDSDGSSWSKAYQTIQGALDAASTDGDDCTLILISPHATYYDIATTDDPTWSGNYILKGSHRSWATVRNEHVSATSVFKFTGKASIIDLAIFTEDSVDGVIFTKSGYRVTHCGFNSEGTGGANTSIHIDGSGAFIRGGKIEDVQIEGNVAYTTGLYMNNAKINTTKDTNAHKCLNAIQVVHADSDHNYFYDINIGGCATGLNLDGGNQQHFHNITFHDNTTNISDAAAVRGDNIYSNIFGAFAISIEPDNNFAGVALAAAAANTWPVSDTEVRAAATSTKPFTITGIAIEADASEKFRVRLKDASKSVYFDDFQFEGDVNANKREAFSFPTGTAFIFNKGTAIEASIKSESGGNNAKIWLIVQAI